MYFPHVQVMTALGAPFSLLAPFMVESKGRRPLFLLVSALSTLELGLITLTQAFFDMNGDGGWLIVGIALLACTFGQVSCSLGIYNMNPILVGELFPHQARAKATQASTIKVMFISHCSSDQPNASNAAGVGHRFGLSLGHCKHWRFVFATAVSAQSVVYGFQVALASRNQRAARR